MMVLTVASATPAQAVVPGDAEPINYNRDIRPILSDNCFYCHGPDKSKRAGKFRLDERDSAVRKEAIVPGKPDESTLVDRIFATDEDDLMPPAESHKKLTEAQKQLLRRWVAEGAEYQPHWAYITPKRPNVPAVKDAKWVRNPVDAFVLHTLEAKRLTPSPEADRRTLLRRLSLDLTGLPPTADEVRAFVEDKSPDAYEKQVERLLASPRYGERMAVPWLDAVRFSDTVGFHGDQNQNIFPYRDYVIDAFNRNKPFDQFTTEQLAGDLLPNPTTEQLVATGFNRLNMMTREGGAQPKEYLAKYAADRVRTVGTAWLGATFGCAECHDHKFDPITAKDFYSMAAFFGDVKQWGVYTTYSYTPNPDLAGYTNDHPFPPEIVVDSPYLKKRQAKLLGEIDKIASAALAKAKADPKRAAAYDQWRQTTLAFLRANPTGWQVVPPASLPKGSAAGDGGAVLLTGKGGGTDTLQLTLPAGNVAAVRIEAIPHDAHGGSILRGTNVAMSFAASVKPQAGGKETALKVYHADADLKEDFYSSGAALIGLPRGWKPLAARAKAPQAAVYVFDAPAKAAEGDTLVVTLGKNPLGCVRVSVSPIAPLLPNDRTFAESLRGALEGATASANAKALPDDSPRAARAFLFSTAADAEAMSSIRKVHREVLECRDGRSPTLVTQAWEPKVTRILPRGNWQDETGEVVRPAPPHFLPGLPDAGGRRLTRLDLARWLVAPENPLTSRTIVNRTWKQFFGAGLCNSVEDLGAQGEWPSHPELLDWLAVEFRERGWDLKHMVRLMVTSAAYRQASNLQPALREVDPANRLLSAQSPRRLEAEFVRDNALFAAGLLNLADVGGPSFKPYQPDGYYENLQFPDRPYKAEPDDRQYRRGVYVHWQRTFLHPMLANFDAPSREDCTGLRIVSNTPQQALTLLNDPTFVEAARVMAQRTIAAAKDDGGRLAFVFQAAVAREPKAKERESLTKFLAEQRAYYKANPQDATKLAQAGQAPVTEGADEAEVAAWAGVCRVVLNLHETITRY